MSDLLEPIRFGPLTRDRLALYGAASGDHNPLHVDPDFARTRAGLPDVIGHGMLSMALAGRLLSVAARPEQLASFTVRFLGKTQIGDELVATGVIDAIGEDASRTVTLRVDTADGRAILTGSAVLRD